MGIDIFAGIPVQTYTDARKWYERLLGNEPSIYPNDVEAGLLHR